MTDTDNPNAAGMDVRVLSSGSNGNCIFVRSGETRLLLDAGISRRRIVQALWEIGEDPKDLNGVLITHEHNDHIHALASLLAKYPHVAVHCSAGTAARAGLSGNALGAPRVKAGVTLDIAGARVAVFGTSHDAAEPVGFRIDAGGCSFAYVTDLGETTAEVECAVQGVDAMLLEANHDEKMLWGGRYPARLKRRVASARGHLSNRQAGHFLRRVASPNLGTVILGHLSASNNDPALAVDTVSSYVEEMGIALSAAARTKAGPLLRLSPGAPHAQLPATGQLSLL